MAGVADVVRSMDYKKRARNTLGVRKDSRSTKLQECSPFVKAANEYHVERLQSAVRKMEADEKLFRDVHKKEITTVKRFHNTVHTKSTDFHDFSLSGSQTDVRNNSQTKKSSDMLSRRGSFPVTPSTSPAASNQKRRHSVQADTSKYGRSFRKLKDAITPKPKRISPESATPQYGGSTATLGTQPPPCVLLVAEARAACDRS